MTSASPNPREWPDAHDTASGDRISIRRILVGLVAGGMLGWAVVAGAACAAVNLGQDQPCPIVSLLRL